MSGCVALSADNSKKDDIVALAKKYRSILSRYHLIATDNTGQWIEAATGLTIERLASGAQGGELQIAARVVSGEVAGVILLMDSLSSQPHEPDHRALLRVCNLYDVPLATNVATAELSIQGVAKRREAYLIFNPVAGQGNPDRDLAMIRQILKPQVNLHTIFTQPDIDPVDQAKEAIATLRALQNDDEPGCIIASGNDS
ncbi:MAG: methylglyoxal synthase [Cyanobacteria bacterium J06642_11]